ncbi:tRNA uridine-5-carboxymethylaminomethyl(34) synthesis GTPase MnmE [Lactobacillus iners]|jgi:tRNA modification GTPase trmE|uniref:tRNA uridine-5-carboxymethylaminomethyl(34) synthesis GTPase MnmE n=1 Tax=Lactobacillus iners TaxID=147802 RepID=UPI0001E5D862|nr:tRNA uridine-5-carboxymethylaminomethyl(34) synthesis GTPase MnmE [Lactobacillus iners]EFO67987.1 tRNA modification GTPase TrmE [Lactobacillus iners LactinV 09V1-c]EFO72001.1 tRNA modification GTPase TrmE [Lactobacillus iners SPIN 2503V10-D]MCT7668448.1 tRNA uridine-5-carboxymethylaminomethyl(34) synthesis GTPase MnmE [Lactobacillus iners]MCT7671350.1 tRNA uridine-5-carboxymethylaminomethyl(34) synthesis GTPase MnmE [Lactobacillus iners]MCT7682541.1 tRNA uridine-5-carboxymethylaminomethyl(3
MVQVLTQYDTIAAIATPIGEGGISIIRVSGENALEIVNKIFRGANLNKVASHTIHYGHIIDYANKDVVDEVLATVMLAPKTFTRENTVEVSCHGGLLVTEKILQLILDNGARMATPGEFTKRAFINGRIDLTQAESIMDIIEAKTDRARQVAMKQLEGGLLFEIRKLRQELLNTMAHEEVNIDYPEYDMDDVTSKEMYDKAQQVIKEIDKLLATAQEGKVVRSGLATAIVGRPNVGKSSLLNYLSKEEKAIVTNIAGTTRDTLEEYVSLKGILLKLIDTAGIRQTDDIVEKIGVERSKRAITESDLVLLLINSSEELTEEDQKLLKLTQDKKRIVILNKADQVAKITKKDIQKITDSPIVTISVLKKQNMIGLEEAIKSLFLQGITDSKSEVMVTNQRQNDLLRKAKQSLIEAIEAINDNMPLDLVQIDLKEAWDSLGEITGDTAPDELITQLFSKFCLGK